MERLVPLMVLTVISLAFPAMAAGASDRDEVDLLSVRQSLIPMFGKSVFFPTNYFHEKHFPLTRLNPAVKPYLRAYLDDNRISSQFDPSYRRGAIWLLGLIGDEQDITRVDRLIQERLKSGDTEKSVSLLGLTAYIGYFAGSHERRGTKGIQVFIERYGTPDAWAVKSEIGSPRSRELAIERCGNFLGAAYSYSRSSNVKSLVSRQDSKTGLPLLPQNRMALLQRQSVPVYDTLILECTVEQSKLEMYYRECFKTWGKDIERLIASVDTPDTRHRVQRDAGTQRKPTHDLLIPDPVAEEINDALAVYERAREMLLAGDPEIRSVFQLLADNGKPIPSKVLARRHAEMALEAEKLSAMVRQVKNHRCSMGPALLQTQLRRVVAETRRGSGEYRIGETVDTTVVVPLIGSEKLAQLIREGARGVRTNKDGLLLITVVKHKGKWYWNPFGW